MSNLLEENEDKQTLKRERQVEIVEKTKEINQCNTVLLPMIVIAVFSLVMSLIFIGYAVNQSSISKQSIQTLETALQ